MYIFRALRRICSHEAKNKSWQCDFVSEKNRREKVGSVPTFLKFARTISPCGKWALRLISTVPFFIRTYTHVKL